MKATTAKSFFLIVTVMISVGSTVGCTRILGIEKNEYRGGDYFPNCLVDADKALHDAQLAGKDTECPKEFSDLKDQLDSAYKVHFGCNTEGACKMARDIAAKAKALACPSRPVAEMPAPKPAPVILAPIASISVDPSSVTKGQNAKLTWASQNATDCNIQPDIGPVQTEGSMNVSPSADITYKLTCIGAGGTATSATNISVTVPVPTPAPTPEQLCMTLNIEFATAKADIPTMSHDEIAKIANFMKEHPQIKGIIEGHTDNRGGKAYNQKLSERRAQSVKNYLVNKFGIDATRLGVQGYGFSKPVADNTTAEGRQKNRRIVANFGCVQQ